jgi:hypothetical protein
VVRLKLEREVRGFLGDGFEDLDGLSDNLGACDTWMCE